MIISSSVSPASAKNIQRKLAPILRAKTREMGEVMVKTANTQMAQQFNLNRPYERRRHPGSRRASTALDFIVTEQNNVYTVGYRVLGGQEVLLRILGMNFGVPGGYDIRPTGNWELGGLNPKRVSRTASGTNFNRASGDGLAFPSKFGGYWVGAPGRAVTFGGTSGKHFLEAGQAAAIALL